jgi:hypothetical protein
MDGICDKHEMRDLYDMVVRKPEERDSPKDQDADGTMILNEAYSYKM